MKIRLRDKTVDMYTGYFLISILKAYTLLADVMFLFKKVAWNNVEF